MAQTRDNQLERARAEALQAGSNFAHVMPFENLRGLVRAPRQLDRAGAIHRALADAGNRTQGLSR